MGTVCFSSSSIELVGRYTKKTNFKMMYKLCAALLFAGAAVSTPVPGYGGHNNLQCFSKPYKQCHKKPIQNQRQECHEEYDIIVDTTYIEECEEIVTTHCEEQHTQVHHSSQVVGHDSQKIHGGYSSGYGKREAGHQGYSSGPHCKNHVDHKCHKVPQQHERKVPRKECKTIVDTTYIEECEDIVHEKCHETHVQTHHSSKVVGHDSQVVDHHSHGYGYHKRSADAEPEAKADPGYGGYGGYSHSSGPKCHNNVEKKCHKRPEQKHRQECHEEYDIIVDTTYIENCEEIVTTHCEESHKQVHHSSKVVGHDSQKIHGGYSSGYGKREAGHQGYSSGPYCKDHVEHKCHKVPKQNERKVPRKECKTIVDTTYIEECEEEFVTECQKYHKEVHHSSQVVGHDTHVVDHHSHGYGYGH